MALSQRRSAQPQGVVLVVAAKCTHGKHQPMEFNVTVRDGETPESTARFVAAMLGYRVLDTV